MIQAIGLTTRPRRERSTAPWRERLLAAAPLGQQAPLLDDVSLEAHPGRVTALLAAPAEGGQH